MQHPSPAYDSPSASNEPLPVPTKHDIVKLALKKAWQCLARLLCFGDSTTPQQQQQQQHEEEEARRSSPANQSTTSNTSGLSSLRELSPSPPPVGRLVPEPQTGFQFMGLHLLQRHDEDSASDSCTSGNVDILAQIG